mmetsp:Transcript_35041/g.56078  ORF Transcript_35041/g.56078 Transcript_35041/m.56078 type:complete len:428 (+) Transcript_35041:116-1399(+)
MATERRLKSKMKKCDPENFTIHDFLGECKKADAADTRFEKGAEQGKASNNLFVEGVPPIKLGNLYRNVSGLLGSEKGWSKKNDDNGRFHLILGGARGSGIPFKRFAQLFKWDYGITPHCNYFRGHVWLTHKVKLIQTLRQAELENLVPESYLFFPGSSEDNETDGFRVACESGAKRAVSNKCWIVKASDASRGERTLISEDFDEIMNHLDSVEKSSAAWCVQRYISNPLLLPGGKKFDLRFLVLVDRDLDAYVCSQAICKTCSSKFSMDNLTDKMAHLSTAAIQRGSSDTMPIEQFSKWLSSEHSQSFESAVATPARQIIAKVLSAAKEKLENVDHADFTSFQVFAFDFILDNDLKLWLLESSTPTDIPEDIVDEVAKDVFDIAINPVFAEAADEGRSAGKPSSGKIFEKLEVRTRRRSNNSSSNKK